MTLLQIQAGKEVSGEIQAKHLVCMFHGYGGQRKSLYDVAIEFSKQMPSSRFIIPNGIHRFEGGGDGYQWFSLREYTQQYMQQGLESIESKIANWIKNRLNELNLTEDNLSLIGFSQGAMLSLYLTAKELISPKNIISYSGKFIPPRQINSNKKNTKILAIHGDVDEVIPLNFAQESYEKLSKHGLSDFKFIIEKSVVHSITPKGISEGVKFCSS